jgi:hypothetical protein
VTNGTFDTSDGWTLVSNHAITGGELVLTNAVDTTTSTYDAGIQAGKVYEVTFTIVSRSVGGCNIQIGGNPFGYLNSAGTYTRIIIGGSSNSLVGVRAVGTTTMTFDNISVREINPLSVSIAMMGEITYADSGLYEDANFFRWYEASTDRLDIRLDGNSTNVGRPVAVMAANNVQDTSIFGFAEYIADGAISQPYNLAGRYGSTFIQLSVDGSSSTANTTPTALPDLSATNLQLAFKYNGTISEFRIWDKDIGDTGIAEATKPSLEPSLSLTFDGQPSSFTNTGLTV